jgi:ferredoxin--NADP+ reductase
VAVDPANIELDPATGPGSRTTARPRQPAPPAGLRHRTERTAPRRITLRFLASPVEISGSGRVEAVRIERNELIVDHNGGLRSKGTASSR